MLTNRLQKIKNDIQAKNVKSFSETELLEILNNLDRLENLIASSENKSINESRQIFEMIIRPAGNNCQTCGRTLK